MPLKINRNFAILYGIMLGDGCLSLGCKRKKTIVIAGSMRDDVPFFEQVVIPSIRKLIGKDIPIRFRPAKCSIYLHFVKNSLFDFISSFGFPIGKKGNELAIPRIFYDKKLVGCVLRGFFATDGSLVITDNNGITYPRVEANGIAKDLLIEINNFLTSKGVNCKFYKAKRVKLSGLGNLDNRQEQYRLQMNGRDTLKKFVKLIGFINPKQIERLNSYYGGTKS